MFLWNGRDAAHYQSVASYWRHTSISPHVWNLKFNKALRCEMSILHSWWKSLNEPDDFLWRQLSLCFEHGFHGSFYWMNIIRERLGFHQIFLWKKGKFLKILKVWNFSYHKNMSSENRRVSPLMRIKCVGEAS